MFACLSHVYVVTLRYGEVACHVHTAARLWMTGLGIVQCHE